MENEVSFIIILGLDKALSTHHHDELALVHTPFSRRYFILVYLAGAGTDFVIEMKGSFWRKYAKWWYVTMYQSRPAYLLPSIQLKALYYSDIEIFLVDNTRYLDIDRIR